MLNISGGEKAKSHPQTMCLIRRKDEKESFSGILGGGVAFTWLL
jgi:hypothetical protein